MDAIHLPNAITLPTTPGAPGVALPPGQVVQALVLELIQSDVFRLQLPQATVDVRTDVKLTPGTTITVATKGTGANTRLVIYADDPKLAPPPGSKVPPPAPTTNTPASLAGKLPVGEAIVLGRAQVPAQPSAAAPPRSAAEPAVVRDAPSITPPGPPQALAPRIATPQQALGEAVRVAAARQGSLAPLFADVEKVVQVSTASPSAPLPAPVAEAAKQVLALRVPLDGNLTAADVKQAFVRSGILFEGKLAVPPESPSIAPKSPPAAAPAPPADLKAALIVFREVLKAWAVDTAPVRAMPDAPLAPTADTSEASASPAPERAAPLRPMLSDVATLKHLANALAGAADELLPSAPPLSPEQATNLAKSVATALASREAPAEHHAPSNPGAPPPPYRGAPLTAQQPAAPSIAPDTPPRESAERLLAATDSAIARTTLHQVASLPDQPAAQRTDPAAPRWTFEVPFATPQGTAIAQFEVSRDARGAKHEPHTPVWRARFSLDVEPMGPVHALVALTGERASVTLWAERAATASRLNENAAMLSNALRAAELEPSDFQFRVGMPPAVARQAAPGRFMDRAT